MDEGQLQFAFPRDILPELKISVYSHTQMIHHDKRNQCKDLKSILRANRCRPRSARCVWNWKGGGGVWLKASPQNAILPVVRSAPRRAGAPGNAGFCVQ